MLRNILANPSIRYLVLFGRSLTDSGEALVGFFNEGVDREWKIIRNGGQIDRDLPIAALNEVRQAVKLIDLRRSGDLHREVNNVIESLPVLTAFADARMFPRTVLPITTFPSEFSGFIARRKTIYEAWVAALRTIMMFGPISSTDYGLKQREIVSLLSVIEHPQPEVAIPGWAPFTAAEVEAYVSNFLNGETQADIAYNYGYRLKSHWNEDQLKSIAAELRRSAHSRRAVASVWDPREDSHSSDPVCLTTIQAAIRDGRLHLMAYIRSNDMFRAYPLNAAALSALQVQLSGQLNEIEVGYLEILSFSAHVYSDCWDLSEQATVEANKLDQRFEQDNRGSFVFFIDDSALAADHYSPSGDFIQRLSAKSATELTALIAPFISRIDHALYLGQEIQRLASSTKAGSKYEQDRVKKG